MKILKQNAIMMLLLLSGSLLAIKSDAQLKASRGSVKQAGNQAIAPSYSLQTVKGKIVLTDGKNETVISQDPNDIQPLINGNEVYYINKAGSDKSKGASILVYNISTKSKEDIIKQNAESANYDPRSEIENILIDKTSNKMFFSSSLKNAKGYEQKLTWKYDINSKQLEAYKDGVIESIDNAGNQVIAFHGGDSKGSYTMRTLIGTDGKVQKVIGKQYDLISINK